MERQRTPLSRMLQRNTTCNHNRTHSAACSSTVVNCKHFVGSSEPPCKQLEMHVPTSHRQTYSPYASTAAQDGSRRASTCITIVYSASACRKGGWIALARGDALPCSISCSEALYGRWPRPPPLRTSLSPVGRCVRAPAV